MTSQQGREGHRSPRRRRVATPLGEVLRQAMAARGWEARLNQETAVSAWPRAVGPALARYTRAEGVRDGTLHVAVAAGVWATQLGYFRSDLLRRLRAAGASELRTLAFHVEPGLSVDLPEAPPSQQAEAGQPEPEPLEGLESLAPQLREGVRALRRAAIRRAARLARRRGVEA